MKISIISFLLLVIVNSGLLAQRTKESFVRTDNAYTQGKTFILDNQRVQFRQGESSTAPVTVYTPDQLVQFGNNGWTYTSLELEGKKLFAKQLVAGEHELFYINKRYILRKAEQITTLDRSDFRKKLLTIECSGDNKDLLTLQFSKNSLLRFIKTVNDGTCDSDRIPFSKVGFAISAMSLKTTVNTMYEDPLSATEIVPMVSIFYEHPLYKLEGVSLVSEIGVFGQESTYYHEDSESTTYFGLQLKGVNLMLDLKYTADLNILRPYGKVGPIVSMISGSSPTGLIMSSSTDNAIDVTYNEVKSDFETFYGFNVAAGAEFPLRGRKSIFAELKYIKVVEGNFEDFTLKFSSVCLAVGINF